MAVAADNNMLNPTARKRGSHDPALDPAVDACACPECGMPMSIRMWLRTADCLRCGTSIALEYLLRAERAPELARKPKPPVGKASVESATRNDPPAIRIDIAAPPKIPSRTKRMLRSLHRLLACLLSIVAHLLMLILLAILSWGDGSFYEDQAINLSVEFSPDEREGGIIDNRLRSVGFELPLDAEAKQREVEAETWAKKLAIEDPRQAPNLPPLERVADALNSADPSRRMLSARDPRIRSQVLKQEGGTNLTEAAVARALEWMVRHQHTDGSWSLHNFHTAGDCRGSCRNRGGLRSDQGATAMVLQAMLGAGQTHRTGMYQSQVSHGLQFLLDTQRPNGDLTGSSGGQTRLYVQALGAIALADAYAMTGDETLRDPAQRAINWLAAAQHRGGGWRYAPGDRGDLSVTGWQLMALHSARAAGLRVDLGTLARASDFLDQVQTDRLGSRYAYLPGQRPSHTMTAEGLLSRIYLGWKRDEPGLAAGIRYLSQRHPVDIHEANIYYWYYGTQLLHHWGGREWRDWNRRMADALVTTQVRRGHAAGSWDPETPHGGQGGRLYMTVLAACTLEVYYRHAPLFRKIELDR